MKMLHSTKLGLLNISVEEQVCLGLWHDVTHCKTQLCQHLILKFMQKFILLQIVHVGFNKKFYS